jgi:methylated-DNA-[protein]-cysteine S-methyltransferase
MKLDVCTIDSPVGPLRLIAYRDALVTCEFGSAPERQEAALARLHKHIGNCEPREHHDPAGAVTRLARYFAGELGALDEQPCEPHGTEFQLSVWAALRLIPAGNTWTYAQLAKHIGRPAAVRAVGAANGANSIALFLPCHRVIAADHTLWGYGGGLDNKRWLLNHEGASFADKHAQVGLEL